MLKYKIGTVGAVMLMLTIVVAHTLLSLPRDILVVTGSATILNLIYITAITLCLAYLIYRMLSNFPGLDIIDISKLLGGKVFQKIIGIIFISYFILSGGIMLRNFCEGLKVIYYPMTNIVFILLMFIVAVCIANRLDFNATLKTNLLILPLVLAGMLFLFFANTKNFAPQRIFPILGHGITQTFATGLLNLSAFGGIAYLYFLPPLLKEPKNFKKITLISVGVTAIYLLLCVSTILFMFSSFINSNEISPLYNATRYIEFGSFFQRLESVFLLFWMLAFACYLSIVTKFSMNIFKKITCISTKKPLINIFGLIIFAVALLPENFAVSSKIESSFYPYLVLFVVFVLGISILWLANWKKHKKESVNGKEVSNE